MCPKPIKSKKPFKCNFHILSGGDLSGGHADVEQQKK